MSGGGDFIAMQLSMGFVFNSTRTRNLFIDSLPHPTVEIVNDTVRGVAYVLRDQVYYQYNLDSPITEPQQIQFHLNYFADGPQVSPSIALIPFVQGTVEIIPPDPCLSMPCINDGTCVRVGLTVNFTCACSPGFSGTTCDVDLDHCTGNICMNGGTCIEGVGTELTCNCTLGFNGTRCENDLDFCELSTCSNGGTCVEGVGILTSCECPISLTGATCETRFCPCLNGGTCMEEADNTTSCNCTDGFTGSLCEVDLPHCHLVSCMNGGTCREGLGPLTTCECPDGFAGESCGTDLDFCTATTCQNGGTCSEGVGTLTTCSCVEGFSGATCEQDLDFCKNDTCMDTGTCLEGYGTLTMCNCDPGFSGVTCEVDLDYCTSSTCRNGGTCQEGLGRNTNCVCPPEFAGPVCSVGVEEEPVPCPEETDSDWKLLYPELMVGDVFTHPCDAIDLATGVTGNVSRECLGDGEWGEVDVSACQRDVFIPISLEAQRVFSMEEIDPLEVDSVLQELVEATTVEANVSASQFPRDLQITNNILNMTLDYLINDLTFNPNDPVPLSVRVVEVINNVLEPANEPGWNAFAETEIGSEKLLLSAEMYGRYFAQALMNENVNISREISETMAIARNNIVVQASFVNPSNVDDILYPSNIDPEQRTNFGTAQSILPREFLISRGAMDFVISAVNIVLNNLESFLPDDNLNATVQPTTSVISTQLVLPVNSTFNQNMNVIPINVTRPQFRFTTRELEEDEIAVDLPLCVFWDFGINLAEGSWSSEGIETEITSEDEEEGTFHVICRSEHLTSFAVLLDVNNVLPTLSDIERRALTVVSIIGCSISMTFLIVTALFLVIVIGKSMFTSVHYFIHLNLSIALLLGYAVFLAGVDTAIGNRIGCALVAALLHYLFTAVFCWMLCEGVMLYLMLVVVFSSISKKWWLFFLFGWGLPIFIVGISVAIIHGQYGTEEYCWISLEDPMSGAIWAFAIPMLIVILVNTFFIVAALYTLFKSKKGRMDREQKHDAKSKLILFRQLVQASIILLPLLGLTWVFGLLSVNQATSFFVWIFTILNSLQGLFIFIFHVMRSEKVVSVLCKKKHAASKVPEVKIPLKHSSHNDTSSPPRGPVRKQDVLLKNTNLTSDLEASHEH